MRKIQDRIFALPQAARKSAVHDCMDAGDRAMPGAIAEGGMA